MADPAVSIHPQSGGTGLAHGQAADEDPGRLPHAGRGRAPCPNAGPDRDRALAGVAPPRLPAAGSGPRRAATAAPALTRTEPEAAEQLPVIAEAFEGQSHTMSTDQP